MNSRGKSKIDIGQVLWPLLWTILLLAFLIAAAALAWVAIPEDNTLDFWQALRRILRNIKDFEALLLAIVVTIFFQKCTNMKAEAREKDEKLKRIGHYAIGGIRDEPWPVDRDVPMVRLIRTDEDFKILSVFILSLYIVVYLHFIAGIDIKPDAPEIRAYQNALFCTYIYLWQFTAKNNLKYKPTGL